MPDPCCPARTFFRLGLFVACSAAAALGAQKQSPAPKPERVGGGLVIAMPSGPDGFLYPVSGTATGSTLSALVAPALIDSEFKNGRIVYRPALATRWQFSKDKTQITFFLKKGVKWPDGEEINAHDVAFTTELVADPKVASPRRNSVEHMDPKEPVTVIDDYTVRFNFTHAYNQGTMMSHAAPGTIVPEHLLGKADRTGLRKHPLHKQRVFGHGFFDLIKWVPKQYLVFKRNPNYALGNQSGLLAHLDRILVRIVPQYQTQLQALKSQQVDLIETVQEKDLLEVKSWPHVKVYRKGLRAMDYICYNLNDPLFQDVRVRRALTMSINIQRIMKTLLTVGGEVVGVQAFSTISPELTDYKAKGIKLLPYDPKRAKELFAEAGLRDSDGDGMLDRDGKPFRFTLSTNTGNPRRADAVVLVQDDLKRVGIEVTIERIEPNTFFDNLRHRKYQAALAGWSAGLFVDPSPIWGSPSKDDKKPFNHCDYSNARVDALITKGLNTADFDEEKRCWEEMQQIIYDEQPYTFLFWRPQFFAVNSRVRGVKPSILSTLFEIQNWWVPKGERAYDL
ncbi:MAG: hypothetical protein CSA62_10440 [Planctomycetota bacterium]|nr:MAG: hypothetical protein CSA62_10440 [Planctomycetota bacterium]